MQSVTIPEGGLANGVVVEADCNVSINASLDLADSSTQPGDAVTMAQMTNAFEKAISIGTWADNQVLKYDAALGVITNEADAGGAGGAWSEVQDGGTFGLTNLDYTVMITNAAIVQPVAGTEAISIVSGIRYLVYNEGGTFYTNSWSLK